MGTALVGLFAFLIIMIGVPVGTWYEMHHHNKKEWKQYKAVIMKHQVRNTKGRWVSASEFGILINHKS